MLINEVEIIEKKNGDKLDENDVGKININANKFKETINNLSTVATSGSYNDLTNKPTITPIVVLTSAQYSALTSPDTNTLYLITI